MLSGRVQPHRATVFECRDQSSCFGHRCQIIDAFGREIRIDVEAVRELDSADEIEDRIFSKRERELYSSLDSRNRVAGFFNCWTCKEAFVKAIGVGLYHPLDRFDVLLPPGEPGRILRVDGVPGDNCGWRLDSFCPAPGCVAAVVTEHRQCLAESVISGPRTAPLEIPP